MTLTINIKCSLSFSHKYIPLSLTVADGDIRLDSPSFKVRDFDISGSPSLRDHLYMFISVLQLRVRSFPSLIHTFLTNTVGKRVLEGVVVGLSETQKKIKRSIKYYGQIELKNKETNKSNNNNNKTTAIRITKLN